MKSGVLSTLLTVAASSATLSLMPQVSEAALHYKHYLHGGDGGFGVFMSPEFDTLPATFEFFVGTEGGSASTGVQSLNAGTTVLDFSGDLLQAMKIKSADGVIDAGNPDDFWGFAVRLNGHPAGNFGRDAEQEAFDVQNPDTPQQTTYNPAYLQALTGADIQEIRLTITNVCFAGPDVTDDCPEFAESWSGVSGNVYLEFFGERRQPVSAAATLPLMGASLLAVMWGAGRRRGRAWR